MGLVWNAVGKEYGKRKGVFPLVFFSTRKFVEKCKRNKIERKSKRKIKNKFKLNLIYYFYTFLQIHFTYFFPVRLNNLKIYKF